MPCRTLVGVAFCAALGAACSSQNQDAAGSARQAWDSESATDETKSTHLWITNRAISIVSAHVTDMPAVANTLAWLNDEACRKQWQEGLFEADFLAPFNDAVQDLTLPSTTGCCCASSDIASLESKVQVVTAGATWLAHFFDPTTGTDYQGFALSSDLPSNPLLHPYYSAMQQLLQKSGNVVPIEARGAALYRLGRATSLLSGVDVGTDHPLEPSDQRGRGCYELGLSIHYVTDMTQPMHTSGFSAADKPRLLHTNFETYAESIQNNYVLTDWEQTPAAGAPSDVILQIATTSRAHWLAADGSAGPLKAAINSAYQSTSTWDANGNPTISAACVAALVAGSGTMDNISFDVAKCWQNNPAVSTETGNALLGAQQSAAQFLAVLQLPTYTAAAGVPTAAAVDASAGAVGVLEDGGAASCTGLADGTYCGAAVGGDPGTLYSCMGGSGSSTQVCPAMCQSNGNGTDTCD